MDYVINMLQTALNNEVIALHHSDFNRFAVNTRTMDALRESKRLAEERIPQLELALEMLRDIDFEPERHLIAVPPPPSNK
jgi:ribosomal 50S subunit-associated protein YjgA (DUF615 family)